MPTNVDWERAWLRLKVLIAEKPSHGKRDLFDAMGDLEVECMASDLKQGTTAPEQALRLAERR